MNLHNPSFFLDINNVSYYRLTLLLNSKSIRFETKDNVTTFNIGDVAYAIKFDCFKSVHADNIVDSNGVTATVHMCMDVAILFYGDNVKYFNDSNSLCSHVSELIHSSIVKLSQ